MKGHHALVAMRQSGRHPKWVFINDYPCKTDWHEWGEHATLCVHGDSLAGLDLRFLVGLHVSVSSPVLERAKAIFEMVKSSGAQAVAAGYSQPGINYRDQSGWSEVWKKEVVFDEKLEVCCG